jgi:RimJ/RimL family protein N-acetyltransferase
VREGDAQGALSVYGDEATAVYLARPALASLAEAEAMIARCLAGYASGESLNFVIERIADGDFVGMCLLFHFEPPSRRAEIGYTIARGHWARGYATEAVRGLVEYAFGTLDLNRVEADIDPRNAASARLLERVGFRREGHLRERWIVKGEVSDTIFYGLLKSEWHASGGT